jgi:hypothetical protein
MPNRKRFLRDTLIGSLLVSVTLIVALVAFKGITGFLQVKKRLDLVSASASGNAAKVKFLLAQGADPNSEHIEGSSALWWAVEADSLPTVQVLLSNGANPNSRGQYNSVIEDALARYADAEGTPQEPAAKSIVRVLVAHGAKVSAFKDAESLRLLKKAGVAPKQLTPPNKALHPTACYVKSQAL